MISLLPADRKHIWAPLAAASERSMYAGTHFTDPGSGRMESWVNFSGKKVTHWNIQPSTRSGIEPGTSGLGGRDLTTATTPSLLLMCKSISAASIPAGKPRAYDKRWVLGSFKIVSRHPSICCFVTSSCHFQRRSVVKNHFEYRKAHFENKRAINTIKAFALSLLGRSDSFRDLFYAALLSRNN